MERKYMIVIHCKFKYNDTIYNLYASDKKDLKEKLSNLEKYEEVMHIWEIKEVKRSEIK